MVPREFSGEWVGELTVTADGQPVTAFDVAVLPRGVRPTSADWHPACRTRRPALTHPPDSAW